MKNIFRICAIALALVLFAGSASLAQDYFQPCHGQDTSNQYRIKTTTPIAIAISNGESVAVVGHGWGSYGAAGPVKIWNNLTRFMMGLNPTDTFSVTAPEGIAFDDSGYLYVVQTQRRDSNILIYNPALHLVHVISNDTASALSWFNPRGVAIDSAQNLYVVSGDSVNSSGADVAGTGKLVKISHPRAAATKSVLLTGLNAPKAVAIDDNDLYVSEFGNNMVSRYNLTTMAKVDSASVIQPMDLYTTGCKLYCTVHGDNCVNIFPALNLHSGTVQRLARLDTNRGPFGITVDDDANLFICDSTRVLFYSDSEGTTDTDYVAPTFVATGGSASYLACINHNFTFSDTALHGSWHTSDTAGIAVVTDVFSGSVAHVFGISAGSYTITYTHGATNDTFHVTITSGDISTAGVISDSVAGGTWFTYDTSVFALVPTDTSNTIHFYGYSRSGGIICYRRGTQIDTFYASVDTTTIAGPIYTFGNSGNIYGSYRFCIGSIAQLFDDAHAYYSYWTISDTTIAIIDQADGTVWPTRAGSATVTHHLISECGSSIATFGIIIDSMASAGVITGPALVCRHATIQLVNTVTGGTWLSLSPSVAIISGSSGDSVAISGVSTGIDTIKYFIDNTCADTLYQLVRTIDVPMGSITGGGSCVGIGFTCTATGLDSTTTGNWAASGTADLLTSADSTAEFLLISPGPAIIYYYDTNICGRDTISTAIMAFGSPDPGTIIADSVLCSGTAYSFTTSGSSGVLFGEWTFSDLTSTTGFTTSVTPATMGPATIYYEAFSAEGCIASASISVTVSDIPYVSTISGTTSVCDGSATSLSDSVTGGIWGSSDASVAYVDVSGVVSGGSPGSATISYSLTNSCGTATASTTVSVNPLPVSGYISGSTIVCAGSSIALSPSVGGGFWTSSDTTIASVSSTGAVEGISAGFVAISYSVVNSCGVASSTQVVLVDPLPYASPLSGYDTVCEGSTTTLYDSVTGGTWSSAAAAVATVSSGGVVGTVSVGTDIISYTITNSCGTTTVTIPLTVNALPAAGTISGASTVCEGSVTSFTGTVSGGTWSSSNTSVATVSSTGDVGGAGSGTATITYAVSNWCGTAIATATVTVNPLPVAGTISGPDTVCDGSTTTFSASVTGGTWTSTTTSVATVSATGTVNSVSVGTTIISYSVTNVCGTAAATTSVTVNPLPAAGTISGATIICDGATTALSESVSGGTWSSSNTSIATITGTGLVSAVSSGTVTISYTFTNSCGTDIATNSVTVVALPSAGTISGTTTVCAGSTTTLSSGVARGAWTSGSTAIATITSAGAVTGVDSGAAIITYTVTTACGTASATATVTVNPLPFAGTISGAAMVCVGATTTFSDAISGGSWGSSAAAVATVTSSGVVTGVAAGATTVFYSVSNSCGTATTTATVTIIALPYAGTISGTTTMCAGSTTTLYDGITGGTWSSSATSVATISSFGLVTGVTAGTASISFTYTNSCGTAWVTAAVTVNPLPVAGTISGTTTVCVGATTTLSETVTDGSWSSGSAAIATVDVAGVVTGVASGSGDISYTVTNSCGTASAAATVTVNPLPVIDAITGTPTVCAGATTTLSDGISDGTWSSDSVSVATVSGTGVVTGVAAGIATITYTYTNSCGTLDTTASVTVHPLPVAGTISGFDTVCAGSSVTLTETVSGGSWAVSNATGTVAAGTFAGSTSGADTVYYITSNTCGYDSATHLMTILPLPDAGVISGPAFVCPGSPMALTESVTGGTWSTSAMPATVSAGGIVTPVTTGADTIFYTFTNTCGTAIASHVIMVTPLPEAGTITGPASACVGATITYSDTLSGAWSLSNSHASVTGTTIRTLSAGVDTLFNTIMNACGTASASLAIVIHPLLVPSVSITASRDTMCNGDSVTFHATSVDGGSSPVYTWTRFTSVIGSGDSLSFVPANGDIIRCVLISDTLCATPDTVASAGITMFVNPTVTPTDTISLSTVDSVRYLGQLVSFHSELSFCSSPATYQWYVNGNPIAGATNYDYSAAVFTNDTFYCVNTCSTQCATSLIDTSNTIVIYADYLTENVYSAGITSGSFTLAPNPSSGSFTLRGKSADRSGEPLYFDVLDMTGKVVFSGTTTTHNTIIKQQITLPENTPSGQYLLRVVGSDGVVVLHFVVE